MAGNNYYNRAKSGYNKAKNGYRETVKLGKRFKENYDLVLITLGGVLVLGFLGYPISRITEKTENINVIK